jgi:hypothetical protein
MYSDLIQVLDSCLYYADSETVTVQRNKHTFPPNATLVDFNNDHNDVPPNFMNKSKNGVNRAVGDLNKINDPKSKNSKDSEERMEFAKRHRNIRAAMPA